MSKINLPLQGVASIHTIVRLGITEGKTVILGNFLNLSRFFLLNHRKG